MSLVAAAEANRTAAALLECRKFEAAHVLLRRAIHTYPEAPELWCNLARVLWNLRRPEDGLAAVESALALREDFSLSHAVRGLLYEAMWEFDDAEAALSRAIELNPEDIEAVWDRALLRMGVCDWKRGLADYEVRMERKRDRYLTYDLPRWRGESLRDKKVLVVGEQGYGDTIFFSRFLPLLAEEASKVWVCLSPLMVTLLWEFRELVEFIPEGVPLPEADFYLHTGSLLYWYGVGEKPLPPDPGLIKCRIDIKQQKSPIALPQVPAVDGTLKIGICWTGNPEMERNDERSIPLDLMAHLADNPWVWLYSLQAGPAGDEIAAHGFDDLIVDLRPQMAAQGYVATGCLMKQLDLVITCCTSVAHLAGVLGVPCWVLLCKQPYWIWGFGERETSRWYPSLRLFRQLLDEDWPDVLAVVRDELNDLCPRVPPIRLAAE